MHVERKLTLSFEALLFWGYLVVSLDHDTLSEQLLLTTASTNLLKSGLGFVDKASTECAKTHLNQSSIEEDLAVNIECGNPLLQMGH